MRYSIYFILIYIQIIKTYKNTNVNKRDDDDDMIVLYVDIVLCDIITNKYSLLYNFLTPSFFYSSQKTADKDKNREKHLLYDMIAVLLD
jgi:hypothetical protein